MRRICHLFFMTQGGGVQSLLKPSGQLDQVGRHRSQILNSA